VRIDISPSSHVVSDTLESDTIVIDIRSGAYYTLTPSTSPLWMAIASNSVYEFGQDPESDALVKALLAEGLLTTGATVDDMDAAGTVDAFVKYTDMEELLLADPIHEVDESGWPVVNMKNV